MVILSINKGSLSLYATFAEKKPTRICNILIQYKCTYRAGVIVYGLWVTAVSNVHEYGILCNVHTDTIKP